MAVFSTGWDSGNRLATRANILSAQVLRYHGRYIEVMGAVAAAKNRQITGLATHRSQLTLPEQNYNLVLGKDLRQVRAPEGCPLRRSPNQPIAINVRAFDLTNLPK